LRLVHVIAQTALHRLAIRAIRVQVVVVAMFERGEDTGDFQANNQCGGARAPGPSPAAPAGYHHVRMNQDGVLGMLTGVATAKAAAISDGAGLDPRFDLTKGVLAYRRHWRGDPSAHV